MIDLKRTPADIAMSLLVRYRAGWFCELCGSPHAERSPFLENSHFWPRGNAFRPTRYVLDNCMALCRTCHGKLSAHPAAYADLMIRKLGQPRFDELKRLAHSIVPRRLVNEAAIAAGFRELLKLEFGVMVSGRGPALSTFVPGPAA